MAYRTQITFTQEQGDSLRSTSGSTGVSIAELVRRAVEHEYVARPSVQEKLEIIDQIGGLWVDRGITDPVAEAKKLRRPLGATPK